MFKSKSSKKKAKFGDLPPVPYPLASTPMRPATNSQMNISQVSEIKRHGSINTLQSIGATVLVLFFLVPFFHFHVIRVWLVPLTSPQLMCLPYLRYQFVVKTLVCVVSPRSPSDPAQPCLEETTTQRITKASTTSTKTSHLPDSQTFLESVCFSF